MGYVFVPLNYLGELSSSATITITEFVTPATDVVSSIETAIPSLLAAVGVIIAGMLAFKVGVRILRSFAK